MDINTFGATDTIENPFTYTSREWEPEVGLYYYRMRFYDPNLGRFISEDPAGLGAGDMNLYRYVGNHPSVSTDALGLSENCGKNNSSFMNCMKNCNSYLGNYYLGGIKKAGNFIGKGVGVYAGYEALQFGLRGPTIPPMIKNVFAQFTSMGRHGAQGWSSVYSTYISIGIFNYRKFGMPSKMITGLNHLRRASKLKYAGQISRLKNIKSVGPTGLKLIGSFAVGFAIGTEIYCAQECGCDNNAF